MRIVGLWLMMITVKSAFIIEAHRGATAAQIESAIGVPQRTIRLMLKEGRLEITPDSRSFLHCEICGKEIRSGTYCPECEMKMHRSMEAEERERRQKSLQGFGQGKKGEDGQRRFLRNG